MYQDEGLDMDEIFDIIFWFLFYGHNISSVLIGILSTGFGTSIYTSENQEGMDMAVKKSIFILLVRWMK